MRNRFITRAVEHDGRHRMFRFRFVTENRPDDRCDSSESAGEFNTKSVRHHGAVRHAGGVYPLGIDRVPDDERVDQCANETHVIEPVLHGMATTMARIPGQKLSLATAGPLWINDNEAFLSRLVREACYHLGVFRIATTMQHQNKRSAFDTVRQFTWNTNHIAALDSLVTQDLPGPRCLAILACRNGSNREAQQRRNSRYD